MENRKEMIYNSLKGNTLKEKYDDLLDREFMLNMKDRWDSEDRTFNNIFHEIQKELEEEMEKENE